jgi:Protein of unknown function (DUF3106)
MKTSLCLLLSILLLPVAALRAADPAPVPPPTSTNQEADLAALERFLDLTDEELDQLQRAIAHIRAMSPEERAELHKAMNQFRSLPDAQRRQLRQGWGALESGLQDAWRRMMQSATPERRAEIQQKLQSLPPENKAEYRRQLAEEFLRQEANK